MTNINTLCLSCMNDLGTDKICPDCGANPHQGRNMVALPLKTVLNNRFLVGRVLGKPGGFGITYLAWDLLLETTAAIKEFLPLSSVSRDPENSKVRANSRQDQAFFNQGLKIFLKEAKTLAKFSHPNIVRIRDCFTSNNTAYLVMDYHQGQPLDQLVKSTPGGLTEEESLNIMLPILDGLEAVHQQNFLHRDIKPQNIYITNKLVPILLDFGASRMALANKDQTLTVMLSAGYAPFEQYHAKGNQGPWSDIYSAGATLYYMVTGRVPTDILERQQQDLLLPPDKLKPGLSKQFSDAIMQALSVNAINRPQNISAFRQLLTINSNNNLATDIIPTPITPKKQKPVATPVRPTDPASVIIQYENRASSFNLKQIILFLAVAAIVWFGWNNNQQKYDDKQIPTVSAPELIEFDEITDDITEELSNSVEFEPIEIENIPEPPMPVPQQPTAMPLQPAPKKSASPTNRFAPAIPEFAFNACQNQPVNSSCGINTPRGYQSGTCLSHSGRLACVPKHNMPPPPRPNFRH